MTIDLAKLARDIRRECGLVRDVYIDSAGSVRLWPDPRAKAHNYVDADGTLRWTE